ncbi:epoxide hydrolase [Polymorphobacter glacialis]|uniref:Epoxide hydrolase n=1 Tax=Sandarakinorhabdus glacialis TaxID=1614636 RepID=A0A916ZXK0_9SPHN|nr:epoxide hydrolase [Polymorphobacter glacialis]
MLAGSSMTNFRTIETNGIRLRAAVAGEGPLVVLVHRFPESWAAWRHQIGPIAAAGFKVCAIDCRGYGGSDKPEAIEAYDLENMTADIAGVIDAEGGGAPGVIIGHDWGAHLVWHTALCHPAKVRAVAALSVPFVGVAETALIDAVKPVYADRGKFFYQTYFQQPGVAEAEAEADLTGFIRKFYYWLSGEAPDGLGHGRASTSALLDGLPDPQPFPAWMGDADIGYLVSEFRRSGLRGPINRYRNQHRDVEFLKPWRGRTIDQPALFIGGTRDLVLSMRPGYDMVAAMRAAVPNLEEAMLLEGCGHWTQQERPEAVTARLTNWLCGLSGSRA